MALTSVTTDFRLHFVGQYQLRYELPEAYYQAGVVTSAQSQDGGPLVASYQAVSPGRDLLRALEFHVEPSLEDGIVVEVEFPDQRRFTHCFHDGSDDTTILKVDLHLVDAGNLGVPTFHEAVRLGSR